MKNNNCISEYNIDIMKNNIVEIMRKKRITQTMLSENTGIAQPTISDVLSKKNSHCFNVPQLVKIASYLNVSTDNLLGIESNSNNGNENITLSDVCQKLFEVDKLIKINIGTCKTGKYKEDDSTWGGAKEVEECCIFFLNPTLSKILEVWKGLQDSGKKMPPDAYKEIMQLWKNDALKRYQKHKKRWQFRNKQEQARFLANLILEHRYDDPDDFPSPDLCFDNENIKILKEFRAFITIYFDDPEDREYLSKYIDRLTWNSPAFDSLKPPSF